MSWLLAPFKGPMRYMCINININLNFEMYLCASSYSNCCSKCPIFSQYVWIHRCKIFHTISNGLLNYLNLPGVNPWTMAGVRTPALLCINRVPINQSRMFSFKCKSNSFGYDI